MTVHTVEFVKKKAKRIRKEEGIPHHEALDLACVLLGFQNYKHFLNCRGDVP